jgi:hypothetical protein
VRPAQSMGATLLVARPSGMGKTLDWKKSVSDLQCSRVEKGMRTNAHVCEHATNIRLGTQFQYPATQHHKYPIDGGSRFRCQPCTGGIGGRSTIERLLPHAHPV